MSRASVGPGEGHVRLALDHPLHPLHVSEASSGRNVFCALMTVTIASTLVGSAGTFFVAVSSSSSDPSDLSYPTP